MGSKTYGALFDTRVAIAILLTVLYFCLCDGPGLALQLDSNSARPVRQWTTYAHAKLQERQPLSWTDSSNIDKKRGSLEIGIDESQKFQTILGFGAALTDASCYLINRLPDWQRIRLIEEIFSPECMGMSTARIAIGSSDYALVAYSFDDGEDDPELKRFSIAHDQTDILPVLRLARKANPDLFIFGSPWSPPGWMKPNKSMLGGCMQRKYLSSYANYFLKFLKGYEAAGVPVQAVTVNNEVDTDQDGRMPACSWPQEIEMDFVGAHLGPLLERENCKTKIWILDHNYNLWGRVLNELENPDVLKYTGGVAWHPYAGSVNAMKKIHDLHPQLGMHWTEDGPDVDEPGYANDWTKWGRLFSEALHNECNSITGWNLALDESGKPNIGPFKCGGMITINSKTNEISYSGQYWGTVHFSKFIRPGAKVIKTESKQVPELAFVAARNPDGKLVMVITNSSKEDRELTLNWHKLRLPLRVEADTLNTLVW